MGLQVKNLIGLSLLATLVTMSSSTLDGGFKSGLEHFSTNLFHEIVKTNGNENIIFSPFSVQTCLAMARMGADGETAAELDRAMGFSGKSPKFIADNYYDLLSLYKQSGQVHFANKVYVMKRYELQDNYKKILKDKFFTTAENIDFAQNKKAANKMNNWIESKTNNLIKDVMEADMLSSDTRVVLLNAIHFKGQWLKPFDKSLTSDGDFYVDESHTVSVPMMNANEEFELAYIEELDIYVVRLPYKDSDLSMLLFVPRVRADILEIEEKLMAYSLDSITKKMTRETMQIFLPKFKSEFTIALNEPLKKLNVKHLFEDADLSKMLTSPEPLTVTHVVQKAYIEVSEMGTEAAAATAFEDEDRAMPLQVNVDHPFHYVIVNTKNVVLFQGNVINPLL